jgi:heat shock protein HslJ
MSPAARLCRTVLAAVLVAGGPAVVTAADFPVKVDWRAERLGTTAFDAEALPTLLADGKGGISGSTGCNRYTGSMIVTGEKLTMGPMAQTKMFCMGPGGQNEMRFSAAIRSATSWRLDGTALVIETASGTLRFTRK